MDEKQGKNRKLLKELRFLPYEIEIIEGYEFKFMPRFMVPINEVETLSLPAFKRILIEIFRGQKEYCDKKIDEKISIIKKFK